MSKTVRAKTEDRTHIILFSGGKMALPWTILLTLLGIYIQGAHTWCSETDKLYIDQAVSDPDTVKFALSEFNKQSKDEYAYRLIHIMSFFKVQVGDLVHSTCCFPMKQAGHFVFVRRF